jgi:hypothetical protein
MLFCVPTPFKERCIFKVSYTPVEDKALIIMCVVGESILLEYGVTELTVFGVCKNEAATILKHCKLLAHCHRRMDFSATLL